MVMAFSGHRPEKLPWGSDESDPRCVALKVQIRRAVRCAAEQGTTVFSCGMARGCDFYFAEAVLAQGLSLEAWLPCPSQPDRWPAPDRERYEMILTRCSRVYMVEPAYSEGCMLRRNRAMIDRADALLTVFDGSSGGTQAAVHYAGQQGLEIISLWL